MRDRSSSTDSPRIAGQQEEAAGPMVRRTLSIETRNQPPLSPRAASGGDGSPSTSPHLLKEKVAQLQARRSSYGPSHPPPKWEGLEGVKLEDRIKGLSASFSPLFTRALSSPALRVAPILNSTGALKLPSARTVKRG